MVGNAQDTLQLVVTPDTSLAFYIWQSFHSQPSTNQVTLSCKWLSAASAFTQQGPDKLKSHLKDACGDLSLTHVRLFLDMAALPPSAPGIAQAWDNDAVAASLVVQPTAGKVLLLFLFSLLEASATEHPAQTSTEDLNQYAVAASEQLSKLSLPTSMPSSICESPQFPKQQLDQEQHTQTCTAQHHCLLHSMLLVLKLVALLSSVSRSDGVLDVKIRALWLTLVNLGNDFVRIRQEQMNTGNTENKSPLPSEPGEEEEQSLSELVVDMVIPVMRERPEATATVSSCVLLMAVLPTAMSHSVMQQAVASKIMNKGWSRQNIHAFLPAMWTALHGAKAHSAV